MSVVFQIDVLERDVFEVSRLIRSWRNTFAPINKIPPEILALLPDFWDPYDRDQDVIGLTHVCRAWREVFISRSSLWADFDCEDGEKTGIYLERSKASPISLTLRRTGDISSHDPLFQIIPHDIGRLKSLSIVGTPKTVRLITPHLSHPAPLLEHLSIFAGGEKPPLLHPASTSALFNENLPSLRTLRLECIRTELHWRNMDSLTSFVLGQTPPGEVTVNQLLDFFESAPRLCEVELRSTTPTTSAQNGRLVSLTCLKRMHICDCGPASVLLDHLLIPVGAKLRTESFLRGPLIGDLLPRSLDNLENFSNFTTIQLYFGGFHPDMKFSGPNGEVTMTILTYRGSNTSLVLECLAQLDISGTEWLELNRGNPPSRAHVYQALLPMKDLRTLIFFKCKSLHTFIRALQPGTDSSDAVVCPQLEELGLVLRTDGEIFNIASVVEMAAARALRGVKLRTVRIADGEGEAGLDVSELRKYVWNVERGPVNGGP